MAETPAAPPEGERPLGVARSAAAALGAATGIDRHDVAVVLGSGWAPCAEALGETTSEVRYADLPGFVPAAVAGHAGVARSVRAAGGAAVLVLSGRVHGYEGHRPSTVVHAVRTAVAAGCGVVVLTNAAGAVAPGLAVGQPVLVADHLNLTGSSPVAGPLDPDAPVRFVDLTDAYSRRLRELARQVEPGLAEGVYAGLAGPNYETPAEIAMLRALGADLVGMSTVHETIAARHLGAEVLAVSLVTNLAAGSAPGGIDHAEVLTAGRDASGALGALLAGVIDRVALPG